MAAVLIVETGAGLDNSNAYATVSEGDAYAETRLYATAWTGATEDDRTKALIWATRLLDQLVRWQGTKNSHPQALEWPRYGVKDRSGWLIANDTIPQWLKDATAEFAMQLLTQDRTAEAETLGFKYMRADVLEAEIDPRDRRTILPSTVGVMVAPYGMVGGQRFARAVRA